MGIQIIDSFDLKRPIPLDSRVSVQNLGDLPANYCYEGMIVYQRSNKRFYKYETGVFSPLTEATGVAEFNGRTGNITIVCQNGIEMTEGPLGTFTIEATGVLRTIGETKMDPTYVPSDPQDVATKKFVEDTVAAGGGGGTVAADLALHEQQVASVSNLGHVKVDDSTIKVDANKKLYLSTADGGTF
jgi:hypothetical protein